MTVEVTHFHDLLHARGGYRALVMEGEKQLRFVTKNNSETRILPL